MRVLKIIQKNNIEIKEVKSKQGSTDMSFWVFFNYHTRNFKTGKNVFLYVLELLSFDMEENYYFYEIHLTLLYIRSLLYFACFFKQKTVNYWKCGEHSCLLDYLNIHFCELVYKEHIAHISSQTHFQYLLIFWLLSMTVHTFPHLFII